MDSSFFDEDVAQLEFELERLADETGVEWRTRVAEELLNLRVGWLLATKEKAELSAGFVSELELRYFLEATGAKVQPEPEPIANLLRPAVGVPRSTAEAFCAWLTQYAASEVKHLRLPTVAEARRPFCEGPPSPWLERLSADAEVGVWCSDGFASLRKLSVVERTARWLELLLRFDAHFLFSCGIWRLSERSMPVRTDDLDFNVHYEKDRSYVRNYAGGLVVARDALKAWDEATGSRLGLANGLDFDPFENLRGMSPLDSQRDRIVDAYRCVRRQALERVDELDQAIPSLAEMTLEYFGSHEAARLDRACRGQAERGVDRASLLRRLAALRVGEVDILRRPAVERLAQLEAAVASEDGTNEAAQWLALEIWYATDMRGAQDLGRTPWWRRMLGREPFRPRDTLASVYAELAVLDERRRGRLEAFEAIRLVREA